MPNENQPQTLTNSAQAVAPAETCYNNLVVTTKDGTQYIISSPQVDCNTQSHGIIRPAINALTQNNNEIDFSSRYITCTDVLTRSAANSPQVTVDKMQVACNGATGIYIVPENGLHLREENVGDLMAGPALLVGGTLAIIALSPLINRVTRGAERAISRIINSKPERRVTL